MLPSPYFKSAIEALSKKIREQNYREEDLPDRSIQMWCNYLNLSKDQTAYIVKGFNKSEFNQNSRDRNFESIPEQLVPCRTSYQKENFGTFLAVLGQSESQDFRKIKFYLSRAFVIVSILSNLFSFENSYSPDEQDRKNEKGIKDPDLYTSQKGNLPNLNNHLLILIISAKHEDIINRLKNDGAITIEIADDLYHCTQELWQGTEGSFKNSQMKSLFDQSHDENDIFSSEYDVFFIKIKLNQKESGFGRNVVSQLARSDSFAKLPDIAEEVTVSNRLPSRAYGNIDVYSR